jgi:hypothetical protein
LYMSMTSGQSIGSHKKTADITLLGRAAAGAPSLAISVCRVCRRRWSRRPWRAAHCLIAGRKAKGCQVQFSMQWIPAATLFVITSRSLRMRGWGVGMKDAGFRRFTEGEEAVATYRKLLRGARLEEAPLAQSCRRPGSILQSWTGALTRARRHGSDKSTGRVGRARLPPRAHAPGTGARKGCRTEELRDA